MDLQHRHNRLLTSPSSSQQHCIWRHVSSYAPPCSSSLAAAWSPVQETASRSSRPHREARRSGRDEQHVVDDHDEQENTQDITMAHWVTQESRTVLVSTERRHHTQHCLLSLVGFDILHVANKTQYNQCTDWGIHASTKFLFLLARPRQGAAWCC